MLKDYEINLNAIFNENTYVISDHHFNHKNIETYEPIRKEYKEKLGYKTMEQMLIEEHNKVIKPNDNVIFLGDFSWGSPTKWIQKLNGKKYLILGNHDAPNHESYFKDFIHVFKGINIKIDWLFNTSFEDELISMVVVSIGNKNVALCHYPLGIMDSYDLSKEKMQERLKILEKASKMFSLDACIHGHTHTKFVDKDLNKNIQHFYNVSCEAIEFKPIKIGELLK